MAQNTRIRIEPDIEAYLKSQSERVIGKAANEVTGAELTTIANRIMYEHKIAQSMAKQVPFARLFHWITSLVPGANSEKITSIQGNTQQPLKPVSEDFDFAADFASQFEGDAA